MCCGPLYAADGEADGGGVTGAPGLSPSALILMFKSPG